MTREELLAAARTAIADAEAAEKRKRMAVIACVDAGIPIADVAAELGIGRPTIYRWRDGAVTDSLPVSDTLDDGLEIAVGWGGNVAFEAAKGLRSNDVAAKARRARLVVQNMPHELSGADRQRVGLAGSVAARVLARVKNGEPIPSRMILD